MEDVVVDGRLYPYRVRASGFWQVHRDGAAQLIRTVLRAARVEPGDGVVELYAGAGLLTQPLALAVGGIMVVASAAAWSDGISLAEYTAGPRSLVAGVPTSTVVLMIAAQVVLSMSWIIQGCAVMSIGAQGSFNHLGFGAPIIGFVLVYVLDQMLSMVCTFFIPLSVTTQGHFSTEIMWTSYRATMGTDGQPNVIGIGSYIIVPLFALFLAVWASRSIERHTSLR